MKTKTKKATWPACKHERTPETTTTQGRCRICFRASVLKYHRSEKGRKARASANRNYNRGNRARQVGASLGYEPVSEQSPAIAAARKRYAQKRKDAREAEAKAKQLAYERSPEYRAKMAAQHAKNLASEKSWAVHRKAMKALSAGRPWKAYLTDIASEGA